MIEVVARVARLCLFGLEGRGSKEIKRYCHVFHQSKLNSRL